MIDVKLNKNKYKVVGKPHVFFEKLVAEENNMEWVGKKSIHDVLHPKFPKVAIDVKTLDMSKEFHMGNLTSQDKVKNWLSDEKNSLLYFFIEYEPIDDNDNVRILSTELKHMEEIHPDCIAIRAQGKGTFQINWPKKKWMEKMDRDEWFKSVWKPEMLSYLLKEEKKIEERRKYIHDNY